MGCGASTPPVHPNSKASTKDKNERENAPPKGKNGNDGNDEKIDGESKNASELTVFKPAVKDSQVPYIDEARAMAEQLRDGTLDVQVTDADLLLACLTGAALVNPQHFLPLMVMCINKQVVRLFTSSTFADTENLRNQLMLSAYPKIRQLCDILGLEFQVI